VASLIHIDTHVVVWLYQGRADLFTTSARDLLELEDLVVSPVAVLELQYLFEIQRLAVEPGEVLDSLSRDVSLRVREGPLGAVTNAARRLQWTRDPFDRLIVGHAMHDAAHLLTRDETIREHFAEAVW
jgi:PIN domain nuclease of toxin-antitoxin system